MLMKADKFPLTDLTEQEVGFVSDFLGRPRPDQSMLHAFMEYGGKTLVDSSADLQCYILTMRENLLRHMGEGKCDAAKQAFTSVSLVYTGIYQYITSVTALPFEQADVIQAGDIQPEDSILANGDRFKEYPNFRSLMDIVMPELGVRGTGLKTVGLMGAGAMHVAMLEAAEPVRVTPEETYVSLEELFELPSANGAPDSVDIEADFRKYFGE